MKHIIYLLALATLVTAKPHVTNLFQNENVKMTYMAFVGRNDDITNSFRITMYNQFYIQSQINKDYIFGIDNPKIKFEIGLFF